MVGAVRRMIRGELEAPREARAFGTGWLAGTAGLGLALAGLGLVLTLRDPALLGTPELRAAREGWPLRLAVHALLFGAYLLGALNLALRPNKILGTAAIAVVLLASVLGGGAAPAGAERADGGVFGLGLDFFVLNLALTVVLFAPLERLAPHRAGQALFRTEWREDLFYFLVSSLLVQVLAVLTLGPSKLIVAATPWAGFREAVAAQPLWLQFAEVMVLTDLAQYWVHRAFHRVPALWRFHAVHHSAATMDWAAGARMHLVEIIALRALTAVPMFSLGFAPTAIQAYLLVVYLYSTFIHANLGLRLGPVERWLVTPRYHHWHHGIEREAIDVNFAIHFPLLDRLFGTHHLPKDRWPEGYGIGGDPVPGGYWRQFLYPFRRG